MVCATFFPVTFILLQEVRIVSVPMVYEIQVRVNIQKLFQWMEIDSHSVVQDVLLVKFLE